MTTVTIPLDKNPDLAALVADKEVSDWIGLKASIKAKDGQTLTLRLEECDDCEKPEGADEDDEDEEEETPAEPDKPAEKPAKALAAKLAGGDSSGMGV
jgi:hypothetical protein